MDKASNILEQLAVQEGMSEEELKRLPRWALVSLSVRCARRAQPLFTSDWPDAPLEFREALQNVLALTQQSAAEGRVHAGLKTAAEQAGQAATTAANLTARFASFTVTFSAVNASNVATAENTDNAIAFVLATMDACHKSATFAGARVSAFKQLPPGQIATAFHKTMRQDYEALVKMASENRWTEDTPVPLDALGPLWPDGAPPGFPET